MPVVWTGDFNDAIPLAANHAENPDPSMQDVKPGNSAPANQPQLAAGVALTALSMTLSAGTLELFGTLTAVSGLRVENSGTARLRPGGELIGCVTVSAGSFRNDLGINPGNVAVQGGSFIGQGSVTGTLLANVGQPTRSNLA